MRMVTKREAEKIIDEKLDIERLRRIIRETSYVAWERRITDKKIDSWLTNFTGKYFSSVECEHKLALWLLHNYTYYTEKDVRTLCKKLFDLIMHQRLIDSGLSIDEIIKELTEESLFWGLGNIAESGPSILYRFRQETNLPKKCFDIDRRKYKPDHKYKNLFLVDDVVISGEQARKYIEIARNLFDAENVYFCYLIATEQAVKTLTEIYQDAKFISTITLDSRDKAFSPDSYVFSNSSFSEIKDCAREFCRCYGYLSMKNTNDYMEKHPLGYADGQYLFGFEHNTPDNTLPIFWGLADGWEALFIRYHKNLKNGKETALDGRKYY